MNGGEGYSCNGWLKPQSTFIPGDTTVPVPSSELGPPIPSPASECAPPPGIKGGIQGGEGTHSPAGEGVGVPIRTTGEKA
jgi:hypothetical protein